MIYYFIGNGTYYLAIIFAKNNEEAEKIYTQEVLIYPLHEGSPPPMYQKWMFEKFIQENPAGLSEEGMSLVKEDIKDYRLGGPGFVSLLDSALV